MSNGPVNIAVPVKLIIPPTGGEGLVFVHEIISNWKSCMILPTKLPFALYSSINTATTKFPRIVGVNVISPVFGLMFIPLIGDPPE